MWGDRNRTPKPFIRTAGIETIIRKSQCARGSLLPQRSPVVSAPGRHFFPRKTAPPRVRRVCAARMPCTCAHDVQARRAPSCPRTVRPALMEHERRTMTSNLTYDELAERLGTTRNAARVLAQRRKWHRYTSQEDGRARVRVPEDELERLGARRGGTGAGHEPPHNVPPANGEIEALKTHIQTLRELLEQKDVAHAAELERALADRMRLIEDRAQLQDQLQEARSEADHAKSDQVRMARDVAGMFDELKALADKHAELHADRARLQAELEKARAELARARRPWLRRLLGRRS
jgi:hypothetical protein